MANSDNTAAAIKVGYAMADEVLASRKVARARRAEVLADHPKKIQLQVRTEAQDFPIAKTQFAITC